MSVGVLDVDRMVLLSLKKCCVYGRSSGWKNTNENVGHYLRFIRSATQKKMERQVWEGRSGGRAEPLRNQS